MTPRGIRNNNPGNIRHSRTVWRGKALEQTDAEFVQFTDAIMGIRALMKVLLSYYRKYGLDTIESIINRWAPPIENDTGSYARAVSKEMSIGVAVPFNVADREHLVNLACAIVRHENGQQPYDDSIYETAAHLALTNAEPTYSKPQPNQRD